MMMPPFMMGYNNETGRSPQLPVKKEVEKGLRHEGNSVARLL